MNLFYKIVKYIKNNWILLWLVVNIVLVVCSLLIFYVNFALETSKVNALIYAIRYTLLSFEVGEIPDKLSRFTYINFITLLDHVSIIVLSLSAFFLFLKRRILSFWAQSKYKNHQIVVGLDDFSIVLIDILKRRKKKVLVIDDEPKDSYISYCDSKGVPLIVSGDIFQISSLEKAEKIFLFKESLLNIELAKSIERQFEKPHIYAHIEDFWLKAYYDKGGLEKLSHKIHLVNIYEDTARYLFLNYPIDNGVNRIKNPWMIIIGYDKITEAFIFELLKMKSYPKGVKLNLLIVDPKAEDIKEWFYSIYKEEDGYLVFKNIDLNFLQMDFKSIDIAFQKHIKGPKEYPDMIFVKSNTDEETFRISYEVFEAFSKKTKIVGLYTSIYINDDNLGYVKIVNVFKAAARLLIDKDITEKLAKIIHAKYVLKSFYADDESKIDKNKSVLKLEKDIRSTDEFKSFLTKREKTGKKDSILPWEELKEIYRNSNRYVSIFTQEILRVIYEDFNIKDFLNKKKEELDEFIKDLEEKLSNKNLFELLAELQHKRYMNEKIVLKEKTEYSYEYDELDEIMKDYDRSIVRDIPYLLAQLWKLKHEK